MDADALYAQAMKTYQAGQITEALTGFEQARAAYLAAGNQAKAAQVANDLGVVYYLSDRRDEATKILQDALAVFEKLGDVAAQARATGNLAQLMSRAGDKDGAERHYVRAAELFHQVADREAEHATYRALSQMQLQSGRPLEALAAYDRALAAKGGSGVLRGFLQIPLRLIGVRK